MLIPYPYFTNTLLLRYPYIIPCEIAAPLYYPYIAFKGASNLYSLYAVKAHSQIPREAASRYAGQVLAERKRAASKVPRERAGHA
jgi:hypothetical protein